MRKRIGESTETGDSSCSCKNKEGHLCEWNTMWEEIRSMSEENIQLETEQNGLIRLAKNKDIDLGEYSARIVIEKRY